MENLEFEAEMITLKDLLKANQLAPSGGLAKVIIKEEGVVLNDEPCYVPGKKLYKGDRVIFDDIIITII